jgi:hypothetical protein
VRSVTRVEGWSPETLLEQPMPTMRAAFTPLEATAEVFPYAPV